MDKQEILSALKDGSIHLKGQFVYGSNYTFFANCHYKGQSIQAVYKPVKGERPLWDFPKQTLARREVAAFLLSEALGWNLVPPTIFRSKGTPMGPGSIQVFIEHDPEYHYFTFKEHDKVRLPEVMLFDHLINNADRKAGHLIVDPAGQLWLIDHGLSFHVEDKLRTVIWDLAGESIPEHLLSDVSRVANELENAEHLSRLLVTHLLPDEIQALIQRARFLIKNGVFPLPPEDRRAYPWPLV